MKYRNFVYKMTRVRGRLDNMIKKYLIPIDILGKMSCTGRNGRHCCIRRSARYVRSCCRILRTEGVTFMVTAIGNSDGLWNLCANAAANRFCQHSRNTAMTVRDGHRPVKQDTVCGCMMLSVQRVYLLISMTERELMRIFTVRQSCIFTGTGLNHCMCSN